MADQNISLRAITTADLFVKDRSIVAPDRTLFVYKVKDPDNQGGSITDEGTYPDYQRDLALGRIFEEPQSVAPQSDRLQITDLYDGIPDRMYIPDPMLDG